MSTEQKILKEIRKIIPNSKKYLFDDCAIIEKDLVITSDTIVQDIHFDLKNYLPKEIGWKAMAVNLSDIASMGAKPLYALVSLSLQKNTNLEFIKKLYKGIQSCAKKYKTQIIGGNLTSAKEISITITLIGKCNRYMRPHIPTAHWGVSTRKNARPGDLVFCTGTFGDAAGGYLLLKNGDGDVDPCHGMDLQEKIKMPIPQIEIGQKIVSLCHRVAMMDASDGLSDCLLQIAKQSKVKIVVDEDKIPISDELISVCKFLKKNPIDLALYGGEDYQLVGTISRKDYGKIKNFKNIKIIGEVYKNNSVYLKHANNKLVKLWMSKSFNHFI